MPPKPQINLLPEEDVRQARTNPLLAWFFKTGVYFLLITYLLVLGAYGFRWYQDSKVASINQDIQAKVNDIESKNDQLNEFKTLQSKYSAVSGLSESIQDKGEYLDIIQKTIPQPVTLRRFELEPNTITIVATTKEYLSITEWQHSLQKEELLSTVALNTLDHLSSTDAASLIGENTGETIRFEFAITY